MTKSLTALALVIPFVAGCNGAFLGNIVVLGITVGIFFATLSLGRTAEAARSAADASTSTASRGG